MLLKGWVVQGTFPHDSYMITLYPTTVKWIHVHGFFKWSMQDWIFVQFYFEFSISNLSSRSSSNSLSCEESNFIFCVQFISLFIFSVVCCWILLELLFIYTQLYIPRKNENTCIWMYKTRLNGFTLFTYKGEYIAITYISLLTNDLSRSLNVLNFQAVYK